MHPAFVCGPQIPVIETKRLRLRGHRLADLPAMEAMWADPEVTRFLGTPPLGREECWSRFLRYAGHWATMGYGYWAVEERATGAFAGDAGLADLRRDVQPRIDLAPEAGWVLARAFHGRGYATEALTAIVGWGRRQFEKETLRCIIEPGHSASLRVAHKCGFATGQTLQFRGCPTLLLEFTGPPAAES